ncbi:unnamed protein product [Porites evermanni]|uniref:Uncharacterized protein n=1 Tax=Porites evermanni TaxID=104178 RepID=A0ABN8MNV7_9CNID|nr:unnamed protein product [Porites evermanni]
MAAARIWNDYWKEDLNLRQKLKDYVTEGLCRKEILNFMLGDYDCHSWSIRTLDRRVQYFNMRYMDADVAVDEVEEAITQEIEGPGRLPGYRAMREKLRQVYNLRVPRDLVHAVMYNMNPILRDLGAVSWVERKGVMKVFNSIVKDQVTYLRSHGFEAAFIGESAKQDNDIFEGKIKCHFLYGSPESFFGDIKFQEMFPQQHYSQNVVAVVCDEVHTVVHWGEKKDGKEPFRKWCGLGLHHFINYGPPPDLGSYVQEIGRAGRDGAYSEAALLFYGRQLRKRKPEMLEYTRSNERRLTAPHGQEKAASERPCNEPLLIQSHAFFDPLKKAKMKAVHKIRNKDLVHPLVLGWHFWDSSSKPRT